MVKYETKDDCCQEKYACIIAETQTKKSKQRNEPLMQFSNKARWYLT